MPVYRRCGGEFDGRSLADRCDSCGHVLALHGHDMVCDLCDALDDMRLAGVFE